MGAGNGYSSALGREGWMGVTLRLWGVASLYIWTATGRMLLTNSSPTGDWGPGSGFCSRLRRSSSTSGACVGLGCLRWVVERERGKA